MTTAAWAAASPRSEAEGRGRGRQIRFSLTDDMSSVLVGLELRSELLSRDREFHGCLLISLNLLTRL